MKQITSCSNVYVNHLKQLVDDSSYRKKTKAVLVEGKNLILDLIKQKKPLRIIATEENLSLFSHSPYEIVSITEAIAKKISSVKTPEGIFAEYSLPEECAEKSVSHGLVLDSVQDPGNLGTLIRTALGFSINAIYFVGNCCDPFNAKAIRSAKGAQFLLPLFHREYDSLPKMPLLVADLQGESITTFTPPPSWLLVLGNEAAGPSVPNTMEHTRVHIPMNKALESLNVAQAGAIILYALTKW